MNQGREIDITPSLFEWYPKNTITEEMIKSIINEAKKENPDSNFRYVLTASRKNIDIPSEKLIKISTLRTLTSFLYKLDTDEKVIVNVDERDVGSVLFIFPMDEETLFTCGYNEILNIRR